jgi:hypothetical protein
MTNLVNIYNENDSINIEIITDTGDFLTFNIHKSNKDLINYIINKYKITFKYM